MIELDILDQYNDVTRIEELVKRVPELELLQGGGVVIEYGEGEGAPHAVVRNQDLFLRSPLRPDAGGLDHYASSFSGEDEITTALDAAQGRPENQGRVHRSGTESRRPAT